MPVIVQEEDWEEWFSPDEIWDQSFQRITAPYRAEEMSALAVSTLVNSARVDDPRCCQAGDVAPVPQKLKITRRESEPDQQLTLGLRSMTAGDGVPRRAPLFGKFCLHLRSGLERHRVQVLVKLGHQADAVFFSATQADL